MVLSKININNIHLSGLLKYLCILALYIINIILRTTKLKTQTSKSILNQNAYEKGYTFCGADTMLFMADCISPEDYYRDSN